jgi:hypothetical protein
MYSVRTYVVPEYIVIPCIGREHIYLLAYILVEYFVLIYYPFYCYYCMH